MTVVCLSRRSTVRTESCQFWDIAGNLSRVWLRPPHGTAVGGCSCRGGLAGRGTSARSAISGIVTRITRSRLSVSQMRLPRRLDSAPGRLQCPKNAGNQTSEAAKAWSRSATMSSICSIPMLILIISGDTPACCCSSADICR